MSNQSRTSPVGLRLDPLAHLFVAIVVLGTIAGIGGLLPKARRDDLFGMAAAATVVLVSLSGCAVAIWLILTRRILQPALEDFLSVLLFGTLVWVLAFLLRIEVENLQPEVTLNFRLPCHFRTVTMACITVTPADFLPARDHARRRGSARNGSG